MQTLLSGPRADLVTLLGSREAAEAVVRDALSLAHGPRVRWGVHVLDTSDKLVVGESLPVESGSVTWSYRPPDGLSGRSTKVAEVRRRAELILAGPVTVNLVARRFRIWFDIQASTGHWVRWYLGVFVATNPGADDDGMVVRRPLKLADKTYRWAQRFLTEPVTVPAGTNVVDFVRSRLTSEFGETAFSITSSPVVLDEAKTYEAGISELAFMNALMETAAFDQLTVTEGGRPRSLPLSDLANMGPETTYGPGAGKVIVPASVEPLLPTLPNVVRFVSMQGPSLPAEGNGIKTVKNQSTGPGSIDQRGEEVALEVEVEAENQTELEAIAAAESQRYFAGGGQRAQIRVGVNPAMSDRDVIELVKPRLDLSGTWLVTSWVLPLQQITDESAVTMAVTAEKRVA